MREISVDLPAFGKPDQADVGQQLQFQAQPLLFAGPAGFVLGGRLVGGGGEARVAAAAASAARHHEALRRAR